MKRKTCFFIGHRNAPETLSPLLAEIVERHITEYGVDDFVVGHYGRFDSFAAFAVREAKQRHPETRLTLLIPYYPFRGLDATFYPPGMEDVPKPFAIVRANEYMIRTSDYLICYDRGQIGKRIVCGECGSACRRKMRGNGVHWVCHRHDRDRKNCPVCQVREIEITDALRRCHNKLRLGCDNILRPMLTQLEELRERELRTNNKICDIDREMARLAEQNLVLNRLKDKGYLEIPSHLSAPNYKADLRQGVAVEYVSCEPTESARELFDEDYDPVEEEQ